MAAIGEGEIDERTAVQLPDSVPDFRRSRLRRRMRDLATFRRDDHAFTNAVNCCGGCSEPLRRTASRRGVHQWRSVRRGRCQSGCRRASLARGARENGRQTGDCPRYRRDVAFELARLSAQRMDPYRQWRVRFQQGPCGLRAWQALGQSKAIAPTLALARRARELGVAVFFITGRPQNLREATERNLRDQGYEWTGVILQPEGAQFASAVDFKAPERRKLTEQGYTIVLNPGTSKAT